MMDKVKKRIRDIKARSGGQPLIVGTLVIMVTHFGLFAYWIAMFLWMRCQPSRQTSIIVAVAASIAASVLMFFSYWKRPEEGWRPKAFWGPMMVVTAFALTFFFLLTLIKLL